MTVLSVLPSLAPSLALRAWLGATLSLQGAPPTVGDTIWVSRAVATPARGVVRAPDWTLDGEVELLGPPRIERRGDSTLVAYPLVAWAPGTHPVEVPGPLVVGPDGRVDSLPARTVTLTVASILPAVPADSDLAPQPAADVVVRSDRSAIPVLVAFGLAALLLAPLHWWWNRRGPPASSASTGRRAALPLRRWVDAGESRAVLAAAAFRLRAAAARGVPDAHPGLDTDAFLAVVTAARGRAADETATLLRAIDEARFAPIPVADALDLHERVEVVAGQLAQEAV